ncbi:hypothetical protein BGZ83_003465 [Gryganskiella cystojenkinii]|nr:hypothetical protein BGZ83_003465 [Gryganskiella cystojenkinii]
MLFLVPAQKIDDGSGTGTSASPSKVLVVLPRQTDLSSTIVVPERAIKTTLGTNDTLDTINLFEIQRRGSASTAIGTSHHPMRDHLGILQPFWHDQGPIHGSQPCLQPNSNRGHRHDSQSLAVVEDGFPRVRRHSHTGLIDAQLQQQQQLASQGSYIRSRSRSRQSFSVGTPYQYMRGGSNNINNSNKTPKSLRAVFRRYRTTEDSPLLTSASFGADYRPTDVINEFEMEDHFALDPLQFTVTPLTHQNQAPATSEQIAYGLNNIRSLSSITGIDGLSSKEAIVHHIPLDQDAIPIDDSEDDEEIEIDPGIESDMAALAMNASGPSTTMTAKRQRRESSETVDIDGISDDDIDTNNAISISNNSTNSQSPEPRQQKESSSGTESSSESSNKVHSPKQEPDGMELDEVEGVSALDADMNLILGMASDMDLVIPEFDDVYLQDLATNPVFTSDFSNSRRASSVTSVDAHVISVTSPARSHASSCTTITISSHSTPESQDIGPRMASVPARMNSPPVSPAVIAARAQSHSPLRTAQRSADRSLSPRGSSSPSSSGLTPVPQDLSTIHRDIDNLRRHRDSLKDSTEKSSSSSTSSLQSMFLAASSQKSGPISSASSTSASSSSSVSTERKGQPGPIYFKPTHLPDQSHQHQNVMIIQSNQWTFDSKTLAGIRNVPFAQPAGVGNDGNQIYKMNETIPIPTASSLSVPAPPNFLKTQSQFLQPQVLLQSQPIQQQQPQQQQSIPPPLPPSVQLPQSRSRSPEEELDVVRRVTTKAISIATRNNPVTTPQQVQDAYYAKRERRMQEYKEWKKSVAAAATTAATSVTAAAATSLPLQVAMNVTTVAASSVHPFDQDKKESLNTEIIPASYYIPPSAFRTEASVLAEREAAERKRQLAEEEALKESFLNLPPSP